MDVDGDSGVSDNRHGSGAAAGAGGDAGGLVGDMPAAHDAAAYTSALDAERRAAFATVFQTAFVPESHARGVTDGGDACVAVNSLGRLDMWRLDYARAAGYAASPPAPARSLQAHDTAVYAFCFASSGPRRRVVVTGGDTDLKVWDWEAIVGDGDGGASVDPKRALLASVESPRTVGARGALSALCETNALCFDEAAGRLYSGAGDGCAHAWDVATMKAVRCFKGHTDFVHSVACLPRAGQLATASEDGTVRLWDARSAEAVRTLVPPAPPAASRVDRWLAAVAVDPSENWLATAGGAGTLAAFHLLSGTLTSRVETGCPVHCLTFGGAEVLAGGAGAHVHRWSYASDKLLGRVAVTPSCVYSVAVAPDGRAQTMLASGVSRFVDVNIERSSRAFSLSSSTSV